MAKSSNRVGMFSSQRGRVAKKTLWLVGTFAVVAFFVNGLLSPPPEDSTAEEQQSIGFETEGSQNPEVTAPIARPFGTPVVGGAEDAGSGDIFGTDVDDSDNNAPGVPSEEESDDDNDEDETATDRLQRGESYQSAVTLTQQFAEAYGTYSTDVSATEWAESLPGLDQAAREDLLSSAEAAWPELESREASSEATVAAQSVTPIYSREGGENIQLAVTVTKETTYEGEDGFATESYAVTLDRDTSSSDGWIIVAVS